MNKSSHLKMIGRNFFQKLKKNLQKKFIFRKITVGKKQPVTLVKNSFAGIFAGKLTKEIVMSYFSAHRSSYCQRKISP